MKVVVPTPLRRYVDKKDFLDIKGQTVGEILKNLTDGHPELARHLFSSDGKLRHFVNLFINNEDIRNLQDENTPVRENDVITIVPSIAGGSENF